MGDGRKDVLRGIELLGAAEIIDEQACDSLLKDSRELLALLVSTVKTAKKQ